MYKKHCLLIVNLFLSLLTFSQGVVIGSTASVPDPSAMLDVQSNSRGLLVPRMTAAERTAIASPATGLLVFQTDGATGFYFNSGTPAAPVWTPFLSSAWQLTGNSGTVPGTHFIGTTDVNPVMFKTNNTERMRIMANGQVVINGTAVKYSSDGLEVFGAGVTGATGSFGFPVNGFSAGGNAGIYGENSGTGQGVWGACSSSGYGVYGTSVGGIGVSGLSTANAGVAGQTNNAGFAGIRGANSNANGTGIVGTGNNITAVTLNSTGSGLAANGTFVGTYSLGTDGTSGFGVVGLGNNLTTFTNVGAGAGVLGQATTFGVIGYVGTGSDPVANNKWGGYFDYLSSGAGFCYVGGRSGNTDYAILSSGTKSTMVKDDQNRNRVMYCTEAPEVFFQDYGTSQLVNGRVHVTIDPVLARNIYISHDKPLKVFIQLEGDCKGVYVTNKTATGFDVIELQNGTSNTPFSYQLVANRADATDNNGRVISRFANNRFPVGPERLQGKQQQSSTSHCQSLEMPLKRRKNEPAHE